MFNFTTQTVYNSINTTGANQNLWVATGTKKPQLRIGNTRFDAADIIDVQIKKPTVENLASVTFDMSKIIPATSGQTVGARIALYIGLSMNSQDSFYANDYVYKGKPLYIEFSASYGESAGTVAARVKKIAEKYLLFTMGSEKILTVTENKFTAEEISAAQEGDAAYGKTAGDSKGTITISGVNGYQQIKKAILQKFDPEAVTIDCCAKQGDYVDVVTGVPVIYTTNAAGVVTISNNKMGEDGTSVALDANTEVAIAPGLEAFGDYNWIIHNLRLPTAANTNFWAPTKDEMPVVGQQYTQFIVRIQKERDGIMGEIVGARGVSVTTHVLYVAGSAALDGTTTTTAADKVYNALFTASGLNLAASKKKTDADTKLVAPFV